MAKLGSFFRRLFSPSADMTSPTTPLHVESSPKLVVFPSSAMTSEAKISKALEVTNPSRSSSPCPSTAHTMIKQTTVTVDGSETSPRSNFLSSHTQKTNDRRLSAPMIIHTSVPSHQPFQPTVVDETTEEALISSLQRFSLSTPTATSSSVALPTTMQSNHSLGPSRSGSISASLQRPDTRSASFHLSPSPSNSQILPSSLSNNLLNNVASASGRWKEKRYPRVMQTPLCIDPLYYVTPKEITRAKFSFSYSFLSSFALSWESVFATKHSHASERICSTYRKKRGKTEAEWNSDRF